ncbi:TetR/AcrR family transcriptional regulator [Nonomuraea terrae]|uniref:TetR/AcrR family transcriptional regulator n=1 Tax=Nonomuraea terrae TaxID=2530383 RepID=UPI0037A52463
MARPRNQTERRRQLVEAAARVIAERGLAGLRVRDVAQAAGLSPGSVSYYFPDLDDLLLDVHHHAVDRYYWLRMRVVEQSDDPRDKLLGLVEQGIPDDAPDGMGLVLYELHLNASRNKAHAVLMSGLYDREVSLYATVLAFGVSGGVFAPIDDLRGVAMNAVALEDAYGLHIVGRNPAVAPLEARRLVRAYLSAVTGCDLEAWHAGRGRPARRPGPGRAEMRE